MTQEALKLALEALEQTLQTLDDENAKPGGAIADTIWHSEHETLFDYLGSEITAIKEALAQHDSVQAKPEPEQENKHIVKSNGRYSPLLTHMMNNQPKTEQEPVAWKLPDKNVVFWEDTKEVDEYHGFKPTIPLYTTPPQRTWVDLTDTQIEQAYFEVVQEHRGAPMPWGQVQFGRALLDKFKEVNT